MEGFGVGSVEDRGIGGWKMGLERSGRLDREGSCGVRVGGKEGGWLIERGWLVEEGWVDRGGR